MPSHELTFGIVPLLVVRHYFIQAVLIPSSSMWPLPWRKSLTRDLCLLTSRSGILRVIGGFRLTSDLCSLPGVHFLRQYIYSSPCKRSHASRVCNQGNSRSASWWVWSWWVLLKSLWGKRLKSSTDYYPLCLKLYKFLLLNLYHFSMVYRVLFG